MNKIYQDKNFLKILFLQAAVVIYTMATVVSKYASGQAFMSVKFLMLYSLEIFILAVYAILWQQAIKEIPISVAYANRAISLLWSLFWAVLFFGENISIQNLLGVFIVILGTVVINLDE